MDYKQKYGSEKYLWPKFTVMPVEGGFVLGSGYEPQREYLGFFTADELIAYLTKVEPHKRDEPIYRSAPEFDLSQLTLGSLK